MGELSSKCLYVFLICESQLDMSVLLTQLWSTWHEILWHLDLSLQDILWCEIPPVIVVDTLHPYQHCVFVCATKCNAVYLMSYILFFW